MVVTGSPSGNRASHPQVANHRASGFPGGTPGLCGFGLQTLSFHGAAQKVFVAIVFHGGVASAPTRAALGGERTPLPLPSPDMVQNRLEARAT